MQSDFSKFLGFYLVSLLLFGASQKVHAQYFAADIHKDEHGMVSNRITAIQQVPNGEMWIGTQDGISYFDGLEWSSIPDSVSSLPSAIGTLNLNLLPDTSLIFTAFNPKMVRVIRLKDNNWSDLELPDDIPSKNLSSRIHICQPLSGAASPYILGRGQQIYFYEDGKWVTLNLKVSASFEIKKLKSDGGLLYILSNEGLHLYSAGEFSTLISISDAADFCYNPNQEVFYLLGEDWLGKFRDGESIEYIFRERGLGLYSAGIHTTLLYRDRKIYYSYNSPLHQFDPATGQNKQVISEYYDSDYTCMEAIFDHHGSLWIATMRGAFRIKNLDIYSYNNTQLLEKEVSAALQASNGDFYFGSNIGLSILRKDGSIEKHLISKDYIQPRIMDIAEYEGKIYMAANSAGIVVLRNGQLHYNTVQGSSTRALDLEIHNGELYLASGTDVLKKTKSGWEVIYQLDSTEFTVIRKLFFDQQQQLLLTDLGVVDLSDSIRYTAKEIKFNNVYSAINYNQQTLLGTVGGIQLFRDKLITPIMTIHKPVYAMTSDSAKNLWIGTSEGIHVNSDPDFTITKANGLSGNEINRNAFFITQSGQLLAGTDEGVSFLNTDMPRSVPVPKIEYLGVWANRMQIDPSEELGTNQNHLRFKFRSISYFKTESLNYRVKLTGLEDEWETIRFANETSILYTNLKPGKYQFSVQARIGNGPWSPVAQSEEIVIKPSIYQTYWFRIGIVLTIITALLLYFKLRSRTLKNRNLILQNRVDEKTHELKSQNEELLKAINDLKSAQGQLIQSEKLASMGHLTSGIAHELNNPLNYIRGGAECIIRNMKELSELRGTLSADEKSSKKIQDFESIMDDSMRLAESILEGASKSTEIVKSLGSFTADAQNFYSFTDIQKAVDTALTLLSSEIGFRIIVNKMFGNIPPIECYPAKINQLLVNVLLNAIQSIEERGEITIRYFRKDDKHIAIVISDDGKGIPKEIQEKIFEPFFTTKDMNPGLGLAIAKSIVQEHHGSIELKSVPGKGTKVSILLPVSQTFHPELQDFDSYPAAQLQESWSR